jgi:predicted nucleic acid-binding protein
VIYLDSSAVTKLILHEAESEPLEMWLDTQRDAPRTSSELAYTEVLRAVARSRPELLMTAEQVLRRVALMPVSTSILQSAAALSPAVLRTLDAVHLASALKLGAELSVFVTYDLRLGDAARNIGLRTAEPS